MTELVEKRGQKVNQTYAYVVAPAFVIDPKATYSSYGREKPGVRVAYLWDQNKKLHTDGPEKNEKGFVMNTIVLHKDEVSSSYEKIVLKARQKSKDNIEFATSKFPEHSRERI